MTCRMSSALYQAFPRTMAARAAIVAQNATTHSIEFAPRSITRAPGSTPRVAKRSPRQPPDARAGRT